MHNITIRGLRKPCTSLTRADDARMGCCVNGSNTHSYHLSLITIFSISLCPRSLHPACLLIYLSNDVENVLLAAAWPLAHSKSISQYQITPSASTSNFSWLHTKRISQKIRRGQSRPKYSEKANPLLLICLLITDFRGLLLAWPLTGYLNHPERLSQTAPTKEQVPGAPCTDTPAHTFPKIDGKTIAAGDIKRYQPFWSHPSYCKGDYQ